MDSVDDTTRPPSFRRPLADAELRTLLAYLASDEATPPVEEPEVGGDVDERINSLLAVVDLPRIRRPRTVEVVMTRRELEALPIYSWSLPTAATIGTRWRRDVNDRMHGRRAAAEEWWLGEYAYDPRPGFVGIVWRPIRVRDEVRLDALAAEIEARRAMAQESKSMTIDRRR